MKNFGDIPLSTDFNFGSIGDDDDVKKEVFCCLLEETHFSVRPVYKNSAIVAGEYYFQYKAWLVCIEKTIGDDHTCHWLLHFHFPPYYPNNEAYIYGAPGPPPTDGEASRYTATMRSVDDCMKKQDGKTATCGGLCKESTGGWPGLDFGIPMDPRCELLGMTQGLGTGGKPEKIYGLKLADFKKEGDISDGNQAAKLARRLGNQTKNSTSYDGAGVDKKAVRKTMMNFKSTQGPKGLDISCGDDGRDGKPDVYKLCKKTADPEKV